MKPDRNMPAQGIALSRERPRAQTGAALFVSLVFLLVLTLIGIAGTQVASLQEKMAANLKERNQAFQSADAALRAAEEYIKSPINLVGLVNCASDTDGFYHYVDPNNVQAGCLTDKGWPSSSSVGAANATNNFPAGELGFWDGNGDVFTNANTASWPTPLPTAAQLGVSAEPSCVIEEMPPQRIVQSGTPVDVPNYRITARGVGGSGAVVVILQSVVVK
jgi:type IV pilus assembly protein PilX